MKPAVKQPKSTSIHYFFLWTSYFRHRQGGDMDSMSRYRGLQYDDPSTAPSDGGVTMKPMDTEIANMDVKVQVFSYKAV